MILIERFKAAQRGGVPLLVIQMPDPQATMQGIYDVCGKDIKDKDDNVKRKAVPVIQWDICRGAKAWNPVGNEMLASLVNGNVDRDSPNKELTIETATEVYNQTANIVAVLEFAARFSPGTILFILNAQNFLSAPAAAQAAWNLRDSYKTNKRMVVFLAPAITLPAELKGDVVVLDEPLPTDKELREIIVKTYKDASLKLPDEKELLKQVDAVAGLAAFPAETAAAMALTPKGIDMELLGAQKRQQVSNIPGAELNASKETLKDVIGCKNMVELFRQLLSSTRERFRLILFLDEVEKMVAGKGDNTGVSQAISEQFLTWTQNSRALGIIEVGIPGAGKSLIAKAAANEFGLPCLMASLSKVKQSEVGASERNVTALFKTADALAAGGRILMIGTSNDVSGLTPEMQARFRIGTYFFDYPDQEQIAALWKFYMARYGLKGAPPASPNWVGREIEACCELAYLLDTDTHKASKRIVPVSVAKKVEMEALRNFCNGRFVSADYDGIFKYNAPQVAGAVGPQTGGRAVAFDA